MSCECYHIGKFIGADPDCPIHNKDHPDYVDRDELERLRAEVAALQDQRREMHADISDLAGLVRRLALALRKAQPEHSTVSDAAMEFLRKRGLDGEVLR